MADASYRLQVVGDIAQFQSEIAKIPGSTDKAAFSAAVALQKRLDKAQQDAAKSAKRASEEAAQAWERSAKGLKKFAGSVGLGPLANDIEDVVEGLGGMGVVAGGAAAGLAAIGGSVFAFYKLISAITDAALGLEDYEKRTRGLQGLGPPIGPDTLESAQDARTAFAALGLAVERIGVTYGKFFLPMVEQGGRSLLEFVLQVGNAVDAVSRLSSAYIELNRNWNPAVIAIEKIVSLLPDYRTQSDELIESLERQAEAEKVRAKAIEHAREAMGEASAAQKRVQAVFDQWVKTQEREEREAEERERDAEKRHREMERRIRERKQWAEEADKLEKELALSRAERAAAELREYMDRLDLQIRLNEDRAKLENELRQSSAERAAEDMRNFLAGLEEQTQAEEARRNAYEDAMSSARDLILQEIAAGKQATAAGKARAKAAFLIQKGLALAQIAIDTQRAVMAALADPLLLGPAKVAGVAAAIASGASAAAIVARQKPPEVRHSGGAIDRAPDEVDVRMRRGEFVVTPQGRRALGDDELRRANAGQTHSREPIVIVQQYQHKPFAALVADNIRHVGPLRRAVRSGRLAGKVTAGFKKNNGALGWHPTARRRISTGCFSRIRA
jgi:hypothetical protein